MCNTECISSDYSLLIVVILSIRTTRNGPLPDLVFEGGFPAYGDIEITEGMDQKKVV